MDKFLNTNSNTRINYIKNNGENIKKFSTIFNTFAEIFFPENDKFKIEKIATQLLKEENISDFIKLVKNDYQITKNQQSILDKNICKFISDDSSVIKKYVEDGLPLSRNIMNYIFFNTNFLIYFHEVLINKEKLYQHQKSHNLYPSYLQIYDQLKDVSFQKELFQTWFELLKNYDNSNYRISINYQILPAYNGFFKDKIIPFLHKDDIKEIVKYLKKIVKNNFDHKMNCQFNEIIYSLNQNVKNENMESILEETKKIYNEKNTDKKQIKEINTLNYKKLTVEQESLINKINDLYSELYNNKNYISLEVWLNIERLSTERVKEILEKYQSFSEKEKNELKNNEEETPSTLLIKSLQNIIGYLEIHKEDFAKFKLSEMSALHNYTQKFNK